MLQVSSEDNDLLDFVSGTHKGYSTTYVYCTLEGTRDFIHRVIYERIIGRELYSSEYVDHKDRNGLNNRRDNLRVGTGSQNQANRGIPVTNTTGYKGVSFKKRECKYCAKIQHNGKPIHIGYFTDPIEAARAYDTKARELFGEFALLNFTE